MPLFLRLFTILEGVKLLPTETFDSWSVFKVQEVSGPEYTFCRPMRIGRMDIAFDHVVVHQPVDHVSCLPFRTTDHDGMLHQTAPIGERHHADAPLSLPRYLNE